jgi:hypothetical protein
MALYEDLDRQPRRTPSPYGSPRSVTAAAAIPVDEVVRAVRIAFLGFLLICWVAGAYAGIVYWSLQGSLLGVLVSAVLPGIAAVSTWWAFTALERPVGGEADRARP